jgi:hypothetical protein
MVEFLSNLIEYSVLRDEYSTYLKNIQKEQWRKNTIQSFIWF